KGRELLMRANAGDRLSKKDWSYLRQASFVANGGMLGDQFAARARSIDPIQHMRERSREGIVRADIAARADAMYGEGASQSPTWLQANRDNFLAQRDVNANSALRSGIEVARAETALERDRLGKRFDELRNARAQGELDDYNASAQTRTLMRERDFLNAGAGLAVAQNAHKYIDYAIGLENLKLQGDLLDAQNRNFGLKVQGQKQRDNFEGFAVYEKQYRQKVLPNLDPGDPSDNKVRLLADRGDFQGALEEYFKLQEKWDLQEERREQARLKRIEGIEKRVQAYGANLRKNAPYGTSETEIKKQIDWFRASQKVAFGIASAEEWATFNRVWDMPAGEAQAFISTAVGTGEIKPEDVKGLVAKWNAANQK
ncbi:MAG: hypothetical protein J6T16_04175, partial [Opitutales bacterium]|nr:hypothetical protein [Opitutales bacterium]